MLTARKRREKLIETPWGTADSQVVIAPGITFLSTPTHGGYLLDEDRMEDFMRRFPEFRTFAGGPWFEEDCDAAAVVVAFQEFFDLKAIDRASRFAQSYGKSEHGIKRGWDAIVERAKEFYTPIGV